MKTRLRITAVDWTSRQIILIAFLLMQVVAHPQTIEWVQLEGANPELKMVHKGYLYAQTIIKNKDHLSKIDTEGRTLYSKPLPFEINGMSAIRIGPFMLQERMIFYFTVEDKRSDNCSVFIRSYDLDLEQIGNDIHVATYSGKMQWYRFIGYDDGSDFIMCERNGDDNYKLIFYDPDLELQGEQLYDIPSTADTKEMRLTFFDDGTHMLQVGEKDQYFAYCDRNGVQWVDQLTLPGLELTYAAFLEDLGNSTVSVSGTFSRPGDAAPVFFTGTMGASAVDIEQVDLAKILPDHAWGYGKKTAKFDMNYSVRYAHEENDGSIVFVIHGFGATSVTGYSGNLVVDGSGAVFLAKDLVILKVSPQGKLAWASVIPRINATPYVEFTRFIVIPENGATHIVFNDLKENTKRQAGEPFKKVDSADPPAIHAIVDENGTISYSMIEVKKRVPAAWCLPAENGFYFISGSLPVQKLGKYSFN